MKPRQGTYRIPAAALACALALSLSLPVPAYAQDGEDAIEVRTDYLASEGAPDAPETIERDGEVWRLVSTESVEDADWRPTMASFERTESVECWPEDLEATEAGVADEFEIDEAGAKGAIPRTSLVSEPVYEARTYRAEQTVEVSGLPSNDMAQIEQERSFYMQQSGNTVTLTFAGIEWRVEGTDEFGLPASYGATVLYRGTDTAVVLDRYVVTAVYEGELPVGDDKGMTLIATYAPAPVEDASPSVWPGIVAGAAAAAAALAGGAWWHRSRNVRICEIREGKWVIVATADGKRDAEGAVQIVLPARFDLAKKRYGLVLRGEIASGGEVVVTHLGEEVLRAPASESVALPWKGRE